MKKLAIGLIVVIVIVAIAVLGADRFAQTWAVGQVDALMARPDVGGSHGAVAYSLWRRTIEVNDLTLQLQSMPGRSVHAAYLAIDGVGPFGSAGIQADGTVMVDLRARQVSISGTETAATTSFGQIYLRGLRTSSALPLQPPVVKDEWKAFLDATTVERLEMIDIAVAQPDKVGDLTVGRLAVEQMKPGGVDRLVIGKVALGMPSGTASLGAAEVNGLAYTLGEAPAVAPGVFVSKMRLTDMAAGPKGQVATAEELLITMAGSLQKPEAGTLMIKALDIPAKAFPMLAAIGYERVHLDLTSKSTYDSAHGIVDSQSELSARGVANLAVSFRFSNYLADLGSKDAAEYMKRLAAARLDRFELHYADASLLDRVFQFYAQTSGSDVAAVRARFIAPLAAQRSALADRSLQAADFDALIAFLQKPGSLTIAAAPPQPMAIADLMNAAGDPEATATKLGLTIR